MTFEHIRKELDQKVLIDPAVLQSYLEELESAFEHSDLHLEEIAELIHGCEMRLIDWKIDHMTDSARNLFSQKRKRIDEAIKLRNQIAALSVEHALSLENRAMLLIARKLLEEIAPKGQTLELPQADEMGQYALETAYALHLDNRKEAERLAMILPKKVNEWIAKANGSLSKTLHPENLVDYQEVKRNTIAGLIGFALGEMPTEKELEEFFSELDALTKIT